MSMERTSLPAVYADYKAAWPWLWKVCLVTVVLSVMIGFIRPTTWTATTTIMPPDDKSGASGLAGLLQGAPVTFGSLGGSNKLSLVYAEILESRTLLEHVVDSLHLEQSPLFDGLSKEKIVKALSKMIEVDSRRTGSVTLNVVLSSNWLPFTGSTSDSAQIGCAAIANTAIAVLDALNKEHSTSKARGTRAYIERVIAQTKRDIDSLQQVKLAFQNEHKVIALDEQMAALVNYAVTIGTELATAELELAMIKQDYASSSPQVKLLDNKVSALREQYDKVQRGGLVASDGFSIPFQDVPELTRTYGNLIRDLKIKEQINAFLETQRMEQVIQEAKDVSTIVVLDKAVVPITRTSPAFVTQTVVLLLTVICAFAIGVPVRRTLLSSPEGR
ncbi:MAG: hypothetical protein J5I53_01115 [Bradyrhizobiaceae bacterium]|nr:hypothetical protein [Bradyrhizobiaceae bacterium]